MRHDLNNHMIYIWENYNTENHFSLLKPQDGYFLTETTCFGNQIRVNALSRFSEIFASRSHEESSENIRDSDYLNGSKNQHKSICDLDDEIINIVFHYLAQLDLLCGHCLTHSYKDLLVGEILEERYGVQLRKDFETLNLKDRDIIAIYLQKHHQNGERKDLFNDIFFDLFGRVNNLYNDDFDKGYTKHSAEIYYQRSTDTFYYYCAAEESDYNKNRFAVAKTLFADCTKNIYPVWGKYCFGIINDCYRSYAAAPIIDKIQII